MRRAGILLLTGFIIAYGTPLFAQNYSAEKWQVIDMVFKSRKAVPEPLLTGFNVTLRHESGQILEIPGFWNGTNEFVIRFSPSLEGKWLYQIHSSIPGLSGKKGEILVTPATKPNRKGAVRVSADNRQRFVYEDGTTYFPMAFEIDWLFAIDALNKQDIPNTRQIVAALQKHKFNKVIMNVYAYDAGWGEREKIDPRYNFAAPEIFPFGGTNKEPDYTTLNIDFFKHLDRVLMHLHENEIVSHLMIYVWNKKVNWPKPGSAEDNLFFEYVVKRYQAFPNLIWDISKEALAYGMDDMDYIAERIDRLRKLDAYKRLVTVHDYSFCRAYPNKVDFVSIQEWRPNLYNEMIEVAGRHLDKPIFNVEHGGYEQTMHTIFHGAYVDPEVVLERTYTCLFAGTYSTYYWQNTSWYELVYDPFSLPAEKQPHFKYYKNLMDFFGKYDYNKLTAKQYFYSPYCLTDNKKLFIYLLPYGTYSLEGTPDIQVQQKQVEIQWFNPLTGEYTETVKRKMGSWTGISKPASMDSPFCLVVIKVTE